MYGREDCIIEDNDKSGIMTAEIYETKHCIYSYPTLQGQTMGDGVLNKRRNPHSRKSRRTAKVTCHTDIMHIHRPTSKLMTEENKFGAGWGEATDNETKPWLI